ncbi:hypothetical protein BJ742DRAFT_119498 [Cladochytrium replicatum]|nr:hypothetical protein BJ742DRAFT_119498 [Cladochytrium replicatum]
MEGGGGDGESAFDTWFNKLYLGGYRVRETQREFYHATTQTITPQEIRAMKALPKYHRDTQTKDLRNRMAQGKAHTMTQMDKPGVYVAQDYDYILQPRRYVSAEERYRMIVQKVVKIQSFVRKCYAIRKVRQMRKERDYRLAMLAEKERRRKELADKRRKKEIESRLHPKTIKDFEVLYNGLEHWRQQQSEKINMAGYSEPARLTALADLLDQEAALIQKIDRLKIVANEENRERSIIRSLDMMAAPKKWPVSKPPGSFTLVDTPNTIRARELRDLYHALNIAMLTVDERLQILLHVKYTVKEFDCNLTREIVELIDREGDLVSRGRDPQSLEGLRKRISTLFLQFIRTPEFNPESSMYQRFPDSNQAWKRDQSVYYCRGCTKYLPSTRFYLSTTIRQLGNCKSCTQKENIAHQRKDDSFYAEMLKLVRIQEHQKRSKLTASEDSSGSGSGNGSDGSGAFAAFRRGDFHDNAFALLQESDMRYLVDVIWNRQSAISAAKRVEELILTRWDPVVELSPWNCVLLTKAEAATHDRVVGETIVAMAKAAAKLNVVAAMRSGSRSVSQGNEALHKLYSEEFVNKVHQKHILARQHFAQLPTMERYLKRNYGDGRRDGKIDLKMAVGVV